MRNKRLHLSIKTVLIISLAFILCSTVTAAAKNPRSLKDLSFTKKIKRDRSSPDSRRTRKYASNRVIVRFKDSATKSARSRSRRAAGLNKVLTKIGPENKKDIKVYELDNGVSVKSALKKLRADSSVLSAEPDYIRKALIYPNDTYFYKQWGLNNTGQKILGNYGTYDADVDAPQAWHLPGSFDTTAVVAVLDSGIDASHPDLASRIWTNPDEIPDNGTDDDGNGYVDDVNGHNWGSIAQYGNWYGVSFGDNDLDTMAQSFAGNGGYVNGVWFDVSKMGTPTESITVSLRSSLSGGDLTSVEIPPSSVPNDWADWLNGEGAGVSAPFPSPVKVNDGATYYLVFHTDNALESDHYGLSLDDNWFADGSMHIYDNFGSTWIGDPDFDFTFELFFDGLNGQGGRPRDDCGHGTHMSGIIGAVGNNSKGICGLAGYPDHASRIMPLRVLDSEGWGYDADIIDAIYYAADNGADVINLSLGGPNSSSAFQDAVDYAHAAGVTVVAAGGNDANTDIIYPCGYNNVIGVGMTDNDDSWYGSNYNSYIDVAAPGYGIYSTVPTYAHFNYLYWYSFGTSLYYDYYDGTSVATPMVSGLAALIRSYDGSNGTTETFDAITQNAEDLGDAGRDDKFGYGRINAAYSLASMIEDTTSPSCVKLDIPFVSTKTSKTKEFYVKWSACDNVGIKYYTLRYHKDYSSKWYYPLSRKDQTSYKFKGTPGRTYYFQVAAYDYAGNRTWSTVKKIIVPYDQDNENIFKKAGFNSFSSTSKLSYYLSTIRSSYNTGHYVAYKMPNAKGLGLVTTKAKNRGKARIYIDGRYVKTVNAYSSKTKTRQMIFYHTFTYKGTHYIKIVNAGTPGRKRFDIDGIVVRR